MLVTTKDIGPALIEIYPYDIGLVHRNSLLWTSDQNGHIPIMPTGDVFHAHVNTIASLLSCHELGDLSPECVFGLLEFSEPVRRPIRRIGQCLLPLIDHAVDFRRGDAAL